MNEGEVEKEEDEKAKTQEKTEQKMMPTWFVSSTFLYYLLSPTQLIKQTTINIIINPYTLHQNDFKINRLNSKY